MNIDRSSGNIAIESFILGNEAYKWEHEFIDNDAVPSCDLERKVILSPMFGTIINEHDDMMVRGKNEHEAGHARLTPQNKDPKWSALKGNVFNSLEDLRVEKVISGLAPVIEKDLHGLNQELIRGLGLKLSQNNHLKPIDEALLVMQIRENGLPIVWEVSPAAQKYVDAAYPEYIKWKDIVNFDNKNGFYALEEVVDKVIEKIEESAEEQNKEEEQEQQEQQNNNSSNNQNDNNNSDGNEENNENNSSNDSSDGNNNNSSSNEEQENGQKGGSGNDSDDSDEEDEEENKNNQKGSKSQNNDDADDGNQEGDFESNPNSKPSHDITGGEDSEEGFKPNKNKKTVAERIEEDFSNSDDLQKELSDKMKKIMEESKKISSGYTSFTANDVVVRSPENKSSYETARKRISSVIGQLSNYTEDAIKALSRTQYQRNLEHGKIDRRKLASLSKSLTKKVFYKTTPGIDLNTAITIMIDESGSIGCMCHQLRSLAIAFSEVFSKLNIKFEILGYTTDCSSGKYKVPNGVIRTVPMKIIEHKNYGETYQQAKYRLGTITSDECNIDGESILYAYKRIMKERVNRRIIFVLSDGMPNQGWNGRNINKHLSDSIKFVRDNGTEIYGFGIGTNAPERFYGKENFLYLKDISELGTAFFRRFKEIVAK